MSDRPTRLTLTLDGGDVQIKLRPDFAPKHVERIAKLADSGFYDGVVFHRVIDGFMAQGGDPTGTGMSGSKEPNLSAEFSREPHVRGVCSMARTNDPNSANSQFFICLDDATLPQRSIYRVGRSAEGMDICRRAGQGRAGQDRQGQDRGVSLARTPIAVTPPARECNGVAAGRGSRGGKSGTGKGTACLANP